MKITSCLHFRPIKLTCLIVAARKCCRWCWCTTSNRSWCNTHITIRTFNLWKIFIHWILNKTYCCPKQKQNLTNFGTIASKFLEFRTIGILSERSSYAILLFKSAIDGTAASGTIVEIFWSRSDSRNNCFARLSVRFVSSSINSSLSIAQSTVFRRFVRDRAKRLAPRPPTFKSLSQ